MTYICDLGELLDGLGLDQRQNRAKVLHGVSADLVLGLLELLGSGGEDNQLVLVLLEASNVGLQGLLAEVDTAVVKSDTNGQSVLLGLVGEHLLLVHTGKKVSQNSMDE